MGKVTHLVMAKNAESFSFFYQENIDQWEHITFFDPEKDVPHLSDCELLYLPGGYPEKHLDALAANEPVGLCAAAVSYDGPVTHIIV